MSCGKPTTAASAHDSDTHSALSISAVPRRCPFWVVGLVLVGGWIYVHEGGVVVVTTMMMTMMMMMMMMLSIHGRAFGRGGRDKVKKQNKN